MGRAAATGAIAAVLAAIRRAVPVRILPRTVGQAKVPAVANAAVECKRVAAEAAPLLPAVRNKTTLSLTMICEK